MKILLLLLFGLAGTAKAQLLDGNGFPKFQALNIPTVVSTMTVQGNAFSVGGYGSFTSSVTASAFFGDGSHLTGGRVFVGSSTYTNLGGGAGGFEPNNTNLVTTPLISTLTYTSQGGYLVIEFQCSGYIPTTAATLTAGVLIDGQLIDGETATDGLAVLYKGGAAAQSLVGPLSFHWITRSSYAAGSHSFVMVFASNVASGTVEGNGANNNADCMFSAHDY